MSLRQSRRRRRLRLLPLLLLLLMLLMVAKHIAASVVLGSTDQAPQPASPMREHAAAGGRQLLWHPAANACTTRSIETFPPDLFSLRAKQHGAVLLHATAALWLFAALAIVCDEYFVASLEMICAVLSLKPDVAGATFMAAGSSAPELFTSIIGVFFTESDVGVSTIVGSAVFNILFIIGLCGLFAKQTIYLSWWPMFRDCGYYSVSVIALIAVIFNEEVHWYEALIFVGLYLVYIAIMYFNERIDERIGASFPWLATGGSADLGTSCAVQQQQLQQQQHLQQAMYYSPVMQPDESDDYDPMSVETERLMAGEINTGAQLAEVELPVRQQLELQQQQQQQLQQPVGSQVKVELTSDDYESPLSMPESLCKRIYWLVMLPWTVMFAVTIPDCRRPGCYRRMYFATFACSILWIAVMSYLLVWMVCAVGDTLGIPDTVMGLTLLAAGTSVPDALSSVLVARDGLGDMAVSNSVGSNVFDILVGLGLPWLVSTGIRHPGGVVLVNSAGLTYSSITLLSTVLFLFVAVYANGMRMDRKLGTACLALYCGFIAVSILCETNVFGRLNPPACPRTRL